MTELERFEKLKELGYVYEPETGLVKRNGKVRGGITELYYVRLSVEINKKQYQVMAHRFIWWLVHNEIPNMIDHINHNTTDNRLENLRNLTNQKNCFNKKAKGYFWNKHAEKYQAQIMIDYKNIYLGLFNTEQEAKQAYLEAKKIYHKI